MSKRGLKFIVFLQCLLFLSPTNLFKHTHLSTQRQETSGRQESSTEITSRKRSDCKLQELCNNCERTVTKNNERTMPKSGKRGSNFMQSSGKMCTDIALLKKRRRIVFDERKWFNVKVYRDLMIIRCL